MPVLLGAADACPREPDECSPLEASCALPYRIRYGLPTGAGCGQIKSACSGNCGAWLSGETVGRPKGQGVLVSEWYL